MNPTDTARYVLPAAPGTLVQHVTPASAGWEWCGLRVLDLGPDESVRLTLAQEECLVVPLRGGVRVGVRSIAPTPTTPPADAEQPEDQTVHLTGRPSPFAGPTDTLLCPRGSVLTLTSPPTGARVAVATARTAVVGPLIYLPAATASVEVRGSGRCTRLVTGYTMAPGSGPDRLLVCEVVTPAGNWSSYPPHKHDEHTEHERELEEIYYVELTPGPQGESGIAYHRTYGTNERPIEVLTPLRNGDVALVPHGFHGPCIAPPENDLYYLNVMAGPAPDRRWLATDDPALAWVRGTWADLPVDPRLAGTPIPAPIPAPKELP